MLGPSIILGPISAKQSHKWLVSWSKFMARYAANLQVNVEDRSGINFTTETFSSSITVSNCKNMNKGVLYVHLNQQTLLSAVIYSLCLPKVKYIVNLEFATIPFIGWLQIAIGSIVIIRQFPESAKRQMKKSIECLKNGDDFVISIEGKRSDDGNLSPYKKGPVVMALEAQCDIVPYMTHGEYILWPRGQLYVQKSGKIDCILYPKISTVGLTYNDRDRLVSELRCLAEREKLLWETKNEEYLREIKLRK